MKKLYILFSILILASMVLAACAPAAPATTEASPPPTEVPATEPPAKTDVPAETEAPTEVVLPDLGGRTVTVAIENAYLPFNFVSLDTGEGMGWDYDFINEACARLNCIPEWIEFGWDTMIAAVAQGQFDMAADGITITEERAKEVDFSDGYVAIEQRLLVRLDETRFEDVEGLAALPDTKLAEQVGTTNYMAAQKYLTDDRILAFDTFGLAVQAVISGDADGVIIDETAGLGYLGANADKVKLVGPSISSDQLGFIFPKGSDLVEPFNAVIAQMKADGTLEQINAKWFTKSSDEIVAEVGGIGEGAYAVEAFKVSDEVKAKILEDNVIKIAWIPKALNNPVFELGKVGAETKATELTAAGPYTVEIMYVGSVASDIAEQVKVMEDAIAAGAEAVGISCNEPTGCKDVIDKAMEAGIPVMTWDSDSPESSRFTYLGVDNYEGGKAAAELLMKALPDGGKIALLSGVPGAANLEARIKGFTDAVAGSNIEVVQKVFCDDDVNKGVTVVEEVMTANPDLDGWFFVGLWPIFAGDGAMPQWEAATEAGMMSVMFDTLPEELDWVKRGKLYGLVGQKYWGWGYDTTQMIYDAIVNGATYESFTNSGMDIVTINNVDAMAEAWETRDFTKPLPPP